MHLIVDNVASHSEVDGVDDLVIAVIFVTIQILGLTAMT